MQNGKHRHEVFQMTDPTEKTIELSPPVEHDGKKIERLVLREPRAIHVQIADAEIAKDVNAFTSRRRDIKLISLVARVDEAVVRALPVGTLNELTGYQQQFVEAPAATDYAAERPNRLTLDLEPPVVFGPNTYTELDLSEPKTGDVERAERELRGGLNSETLRKYQIVLVSKASGLGADVIQSLPIRKLDEASRYLQGFINPGRQTGETSSPG